jgi:hypothetical protein
VRGEGERYGPMRGGALRFAGDEWGSVCEWRAAAPRGRGENDDEGSAFTGLGSDNASWSSEKAAGGAQGVGCDQCSGYSLEGMG